MSQVTLNGTWEEPASSRFFSTSLTRLAICREREGERERKARDWEGERDSGIEGERERWIEGERERGREGEREGGREGEMKRGREQRETEGGREGGREREREREKGPFITHLE